MPTILLLSADCGSGHRQAGDNLHRELKKLLPGFEIEHKSLNLFANKFQNLAIDRLWEIVSTSPILNVLYAALHRRAVSNDFVADVLSRLIRSIGIRVEKFYKEIDIRGVIALHPAAASAAVEWKHSRHFYLGVVATDMIVHSWQTMEGVDTVFCDALSILKGDRAEVMHQNGDIERVGMPICASFFEQIPSRPIDVSSNILITFGAKGISRNWHLSDIFKLIQSEPFSEVRIVCGTSAKLRTKVEKLITELKLQSRVSVYGLEFKMNKHVLWADVVFGKLGGLTVGEALASRTPIVALGVLPGQEEYNYLAASSVGLCEKANCFIQLEAAFQRLKFKKRGIGNLLFLPCHSRGAGDVAARIMAGMKKHDLSDLKTTEDSYPKCAII